MIEYGYIEYNTTRKYKEIKYENYREDSKLKDAIITFEDNSVYKFIDVMELYFPIEGRMIIICRNFKAISKK